MVKSFLHFILLSLAFAVPASATNPMFTASGVVKKVYDGNSLELEGSNNLDVVLMGVKVPIPRTQDGNKACKALERKVLGKMVVVSIYDRIDSRQRRDNNLQYKMVSVVMLANRNINKEIVSEGLAQAVKLGYDKDFDAELVAAEGEARKHNRGLWKKSNSSPP